ncbi:uncharacterized protein [Porites lutea]|uniref:uncharacterized protein n=1 Tax=Porites lutea TaxID=51062 RepID=UPI003CC5EBC4
MLFVKLVEVLAKLSMVAPLFAVGQRYTTQDRKFYKLQSKSLLGNVTIVSHVKDYYDCSFMCVKYGHLTCLSFNFNTTVNEDGFHFCELSNSERYLEPQKTQEMPGNDYYGTTTEFLFSFWPCLSSPCNYGGTCTNGPGEGEFSCQCKPEVSVRPFIDDACNIDLTDVYFNPVPQYTNLYIASVERYRLNYYDAQRFCELHRATLATQAQLLQAWNNGFEHCAYAWLADGTVLYPMQVASPLCGNFVGLGGLGEVAKTNTYDAWCYKD